MAVEVTVFEIILWTFILIFTTGFVVYHIAKDEN